MFARKTTLLIAILTLQGCATSSVLSEQDIETRYPSLISLEKKLQDADAQEVDMLADQAFSDASEKVQAARKAAGRSEKDAQVRIVAAEEALGNARASATRASYELDDVMSARKRALAAGASAKSAESFAEAEDKLRHLGNLMADGRVARVREERQALVKAYQTLEINALKTATGAQAETRILAAKKAGADKLAPLTLAEAQEQLNLSRKVLEANADARDKAALHAQNAYDLAGKANQIVEVIRELEQSEMTDEQVVLWYQRQLQTAVGPVTETIDFSRTNRDVVSAIRQQMIRLKEDAQVSEQSLIALNEQQRRTIAEKDRIISELKATSQADKQKQAEMEGRFRVVQALFTPAEAEVYRQGNDVLIRAYGFKFRSGQSEISSENFALLNKLTKAIGQFPASKVEISGHTDNRGADELNQTLSAARAEKVARFLNEVGGIAAKRLQSKGYGESRPLASNESEEGRASNRRVEILIRN